MFDQMFLNLVGNTFAFWEANFVSAIKQNKTAKCTMCFKQYLMCVCLFVNVTRFDLYSVILFFVSTGEIGENPQGKSIFPVCPSLADMRMRICYQNNGGSNISKRENSEL